MNSSSREPSRSAGSALDWGAYEIVYAKVDQNEPYGAAPFLIVEDAVTGERLRHCTEVDVTGAWRVQNRYNRGPDGEFISRDVERVDGPVRIYPNEDRPDDFDDLLRMDVRRGLVRLRPVAVGALL